HPHRDVALLVSSCFATHDYRSVPSAPTRRSSDLFTSGRWLPPTSGRLRNQTSPGRNRPAGILLRNSLTVNAITPMWMGMSRPWRSEEHTSELQSPDQRVCPLLLEKKKTNTT